MIEDHPFVSGKWRNNIQPPLPPLSKWFINDKSFGYLPSINSESIFLGTFPTYNVVNRLRVGGNKEFFYGSIDNRFWSLLNNISLVATEHDIFNLLAKADFGVSDILRKIDRKGKSSSDKALTPLIFNDIIDLKINFPNLVNIYVTSGGKASITNGSSVSTAKWLRDSLTLSGFTVTGFNVEGFKKRIRVFRDGNLIWDFNLIVLWSPAPSGNIAVQGFINRNPGFADMLQALPVAYAGMSTTHKARLIQWAYLLHLHMFPLHPQLYGFIGAHTLLLDDLFA